MAPRRRRESRTTTAPTQRPVATDQRLRRARKVQGPRAALRRARGELCGLRRRRRLHAAVPRRRHSVAARRRGVGQRVAGARAERATARRLDLRRPVHGDEPRNEVDRRWLGRERRLRRAVRALRRQKQRAGRLGCHGVCSTLNGAVDIECLGRRLRRAR